MSLAIRIQNDLTGAMKSRDSFKLNTLRMVKSALQNEEIQLGRPLEDEETVKLLVRLTKQRKESIEQFTRGGRPELAELEARELELIESYLPAAPSQAELETAIRESIAAAEASDVKAMGKVMALVTARFRGRPVDGKALSAAVRQALSEPG